jgi:hypothetical protein
MTVSRQGLVRFFTMKRGDNLPFTGFGLWWRNG